MDLLWGKKGSPQKPRLEAKSRTQLPDSNIIDPYYTRPQASSTAGNAFISLRPILSSTRCCQLCPQHFRRAPVPTVGSQGNLEAGDYDPARDGEFSALYNNELNEDVVEFLSLWISSAGSSLDLYNCTERLTREMDFLAPFAVPDM